MIRITNLRNWGSLFGPEKILLVLHGRDFCNQADDIVNHSHGLPVTTDRFVATNLRKLVLFLSASNSLISFSVPEPIRLI